MSVIDIKAITYIRNGNRILSDVSWRIEQGQQWAVLGANGSGKTSLLKILTGYEWPTDGTVSVLGETFGRCDLRELRRRIGWVSSALEHRLPGNDTALEVVVSGYAASIGLYQSEWAPEQWDGAGVALERMSAVAMAERRYGLLSQGEQQRVLIARALVSRPVLLILDEPCAGLDPAARERFLADLEQLTRHPHAPTLVVVTHHIEEIMPSITHVLALKAGSVLAHGPVAEVLTSEVLSDAFSFPCAVAREAGRFHLKPVRPA